MPEPHDFAVRLQMRSSSRIESVHRLPRSTFVTIAKRPSWWVRDGENDASDLGNRTTMQSCDTLARRANHPARVKPCQVTSNCFAEVAPANAGAHTPRFVLWPKICDGFLALSHPLVVMGPCVRRDDRGEVRDGSLGAAQHPGYAAPLRLRASFRARVKRAGPEPIGPRVRTGSAPYPEPHYSPASAVIRATALRRPGCEGFCRNLPFRGSCECRDCTALVADVVIG
jgi:hypothetical protein